MGYMLLQWYGFPYAFMFGSYGLPCTFFLPRRREFGCPQCAMGVAGDPYTVLLLAYDGFPCGFVIVRFTVCIRA